jgi:hypothetical protein
MAFVRYAGHLTWDTAGFARTVPNQAPTVNAGPDLSATVGAATALNGSASDDGLPAGSTLAYSWSKTSGAGTVIFANSAAAITTASFSAVGTYVLRLTASDSVLSAYDELSVAVTASGSSQDTVWVEDAIPSAGTETANTEPWLWISANPTPHSGSLAHTSGTGGGGVQHCFIGATALALQSGDRLFCYVYLDSANPPGEVMIQWHATDGSGWTHRAYWSADANPIGLAGYPAGPLPASGQWVRLEVAVENVGLAGVSIDGMAFVRYAGHLTWDTAGFARGVLDSDHDGLPDPVDAYPTIPDTTLPSFTITAPVEGANLP